MISRKPTILLLLVVAALSILFTACQPYRNFTTYYNRMYNMERIMDEVDDEVEYLREDNEPQPSYYIPYDDVSMRDGANSYLAVRSLSPEEAKKNKNKLDSILLKGSVLLTRNAQSDYVDDAVFYIAKAYFYEREWVQSQKKAEELIKQFPDSKWQPDAHLYLAMNLLQQGDPEKAEQVLSQAVDIAWKFKRQDILAEAFRLNGELQFAKGDIKGAVRPYERAILLSESGEEKARWQYEIGVMYFRNGDFQKSVEEFNKVSQYSPDDITEFQAGLQSAVALRAMGKHAEAKEQLAVLHDDGDFEDWYGMVEVEQMSLQVDINGGKSLPDSTVQRIDSVFEGKNFAAYGIYERGIRALRAGDYDAAYTNFARVQSATAQFQRRAREYALILGYYREQHKRAGKAVALKLLPFPDTLAIIASDSYYNIARIFSTLAVPDSMKHYYLKSQEWAPAGTKEAARAIFARSIVARQEGSGYEADSLLDVLVNNYETTVYAEEARMRLGYTAFANREPSYDIFKSGRSYMKVGNDSLAVAQFTKVIEEYPQSDYAPQSYYAIGLIYERRSNSMDSAFRYYSQILDKYPGSPQAREVKPIVDAVLSSKTKKVPGNGAHNNGLIPLGSENATVDDQARPKMEIQQDGFQNVDPNSTLAPNATAPAVLPNIDVNATVKPMQVPAQTVPAITPETDTTTKAVEEPAGGDEEQPSSVQRRGRRTANEEDPN